MADFSRLPYHDGKKQLDVNPDIAYVSEEIVSHPFQDQGFHLKRGVHLHWALPDAINAGRKHREAESWRQDREKHGLSGGPQPVADYAQ